MPAIPWAVIAIGGLIGFRVHAGYWESRSPGCFDTIVKELYANDWPLA